MNCASCKARSNAWSRERVGPVTEREVCLYTNTLEADVIADDGNEFVVDRLPADPRIIVASPCSGHGAKFATAIGSMLADLVLDPQPSLLPPSASNGSLRSRGVP